VGTLQLMTTSTGFAVAQAPGYQRVQPCCFAFRALAVDVSHEKKEGLPGGGGESRR